MKVWLLTAEVESDSDYEGLSAVHATPDGALKRFEEWRRDADLAWDDVYGDVTRIDGFMGKDVLLPSGGELHWGINEMVVGE